MALERIQPLVRLPSLRSPVDPGQALVRAATERLPLVLSQSAAGELLGRSEDGRSFRLGSAADAGFSLVPGQILRVRIVRTSPTLEFVLLDGDGDADDTGSSAPRSSRQLVPAEREPAAMRLDQAAMLRLTRSAIEPPALAAAWRALALAHLQRLGTVPPGSHLDASTASSASSTAAMQLQAAWAGATVEQGAHTAEAVLMLRVQAWADWPVTLWLVQRGGPYAGTNRRGARRNAVRLLLTLQLPAWGPIDIEVDVLDTAVALTLTTPRSDALSPLRDSINAIVQRLVAAGLRLVRCRVQEGATRDLMPPATARGLGALGAAPPPLALFRAATEVLAALSPPSR
jgi:hypothetical protein